ncbi:MAG: glycine zipper 2TM domain-containing protein [Sulfuricella sp.]
MNTTPLKKSLGLLAILVGASTSAMAGHDDDYTRGNYQDYARVRSVTPEYDRVNAPRQECMNEYIQGNGYRHERDSSERSYTGTVIGGITGALIGSRFGNGNGKQASTVAGAIAGAVIGDKVQANGRYARNDDDDYNDRGREVRRCRTVDNWENRLTGYRVVYEYAGRSYTTVMPNDPGRQIQVRVSVVPAASEISRNSYR